MKPVQGLLNLLCGGVPDGRGNDEIRRAELSGVHFQWDDITFRDQLNQCTIDFPLIQCRRQLLSKRFQLKRTRGKFVQDQLIRCSR